MTSGTGKTRDEAAAAHCPTPCDDDCDVDCHEWHQAAWRRDHDPRDCPGTHICHGTVTL